MLILLQPKHVSYAFFLPVVSEQALHFWGFENAGISNQFLGAFIGWW